MISEQPPNRVYLLDGDIVAFPSLAEMLTTDPERHQQFCVIRLE